MYGSLFRRPLKTRLFDRCQHDSASAARLVSDESSATTTMSSSAPARPAARPAAAAGGGAPRAGGEEEQSTFQKLFSMAQVGYSMFNVWWHIHLTWAE